MSKHDCIVLSGKLEVVSPVNCLCHRLGNKVDAIHRLYERSRPLSVVQRVTAVSPGAPSIQRTCVANYTTGEQFITVYPAVRIDLANCKHRSRSLARAEQTVARTDPVDPDLLDSARKPDDLFAALMLAYIN